MILKVQLSQFTTGQTQMALVYNKERTVSSEFPAFPSLLEYMKGRPKVYIHGEVIHDELVIDGEAPCQDW